MMYAVAAFRPAIVQLLLDNGAQASNQALQNASCGEIAELLTTHGADAYLCDSGASARLLISRGANINSHDGKSIPLHVAVGYRRHAEVQFLIQQGADINAVCAYSHETCLFDAAYHHDDGKIDILIDAGIDISIEDQFNRTAYGKCQSSNQSDANDGGFGGVRHSHAFLQLLRPAIDALYTVITDDFDAEVAIRLTERAIKQGADVTHTKTETHEAYNRSALHEACKYSKIEIVKLLLSHDAPVNLIDKNTGNTPLHDTSDCDIAKILLDAGADIEVENDSKQTPLESAINTGHDAIASILLLSREATIDISKVTLHNCHSRNLALLLIDKGCDMNARTGDDKLTVLHSAVINSNKELIDVLISRGVSVHAIDKNRKTPLHHCTSLEIAKQLVSARADIEARDKWGNTPLHVSAGAAAGQENYFDDDDADADSEIITQQWELVKFLIAKGADVNATCHGSETLLHMIQDVEFTRMLLSTGKYNLNAKDCYGRTCSAVSWDMTKHYSC
eukprot:11568-Heterococcus_DN1.PRE.2